MLAFLGQQAAPVSPRDLIAAMGVSAVPVQQSIKRLVAAGTVVVSGATLNRRIGVPRVMGTQPKSTPAASATPRESKPAVDNSTLRRLEGEITRVLRSGASYDTRELRRNISAAFPTIALEDIDAACADMARAGAVERIRISERLTRYRLYPKRKADD